MWALTSSDMCVLWSRQPLLFKGRSILAVLKLFNDGERIIPVRHARRFFSVGGTNRWTIALALVSFRNAVSGWDWARTLRILPKMVADSVPYSLGCQLEDIFVFNPFKIPNAESQIHASPPSTRVAIHPTSIDFSTSSVNEFLGGDLFIISHMRFIVFKCF